MKRIVVLLSIAAISLFASQNAGACTGIAFTALDGSRVVARTIEWGASVLHSGYVIVPRGYRQQSFTPEGTDGHVFVSRYGYVGLSTELDQFIVEGVNEAGLSAGLFFFPGYGKYVDYNPANKENTISDMQFVAWVLSNFSTIDEVKQGLECMDLVTLNNAIGSVHWRISEPSGRMVVLEVIDGVPQFYENRLGVLTNAPGFEWHMTNLNNYISLYPGDTPPKDLNESIRLKAFGAGAGMLGLPGDVTPTSRFVRAAFFQATAPQYATGEETVLLSFQILSSFNIPIGVEYKDGKVPEGLPSATQWTVATDQKALKIYYRTAWNSTIRCIDLNSINFAKVKYQSHPMDNVKEQPIEMVKVK